MCRVNETTLLAPFEIWEVPFDHATIKFHKPLMLTPTRMPHDPDEPSNVEYWEIVVPELGLSAFGTDHESLWDCVQSCIRVAWKEYVCEDDRNLLALAKSYKDAYLTIAEVVDE